MSIPIDDWQFWVVTVVAGVALWFVLRELVPGKWWPWKRKGKGKKAALTIEGKGRKKER